MRKQLDGVDHATATAKALARIDGCAFIVSPHAGAWTIEDILPVAPSVRAREVMAEALAFAHADAAGFEGWLRFQQEQAQGRGRS